MNGEQWYGGSTERCKGETGGRRVNWDWWRKWGQNVVLGKELKLVCERGGVGREKKSGVKR